MDPGILLFPNDLSGVSVEQTTGNRFTHVSLSFFLIFLANPQELVL